MNNIQLSNVRLLRSIGIAVLFIVFSSRFFAQTPNDRGVTGNCGGTTNASVNPVCNGGTTVLTLSGNDFWANTYQWQQNVNGGGWVNVVGGSGATTSSYTTPALSSANTYQYRCNVSGSSGFCTSNSSTTLTITVNATPTTSAAGGDQSVCATTATLAGNTPAAGTGTWTLVSGSGTITTPSSPTSGLTALGAGANTFRWTIANSGCTSSTDDVIITNNTATGGTASATSCATSSTLSLSGYNGTIQWQQSVNGGAYADIAGATTTPYTATLVFGNSYNFRANLTSACGTATSSIASVAAGGAATNITFNSPSLALSVYNGYCNANYTFTQSTTAARESSINSGVTATINFMAGTNATVMSSGTFNGVAINMATVTTTLTSVTFTTPTSVCANTAFTIVLNTIGNPPWGFSGNASVSIPNASGGTDSYSTYSATMATSLAGFFDGTLSGSSPTYATSNGSGKCVNNLTAGNTYCYNFTYPSSGSIQGSIVIDQGTAPAACGSSSQYTSVNPANGGGCASTALSGMTEFSAECTSMYGGMEMGSSCGSGMTAGTVYTVCYTVPAGCSGVNICPIINCSAGNCGGGGTVLPIELLYFNAVMDGGIVKLNWATATEINNDYFTLERSADAKTFIPFGRVEGAGNSTSILNYNSIDEKPLTGVSYYRLKQTDFDGKYAYSKIVSVELNVNSPLKLMYVSPVQNNEGIQYQYTYNQDKPLVVEVMDVVGKTVYSFKVSSENSGQPLNIDASGLSKGVYLLKISDGIYSEVKRFVY